MESIISYIIDFLSRSSVSKLGIVHYGLPENACDKTKIIIIPAFNNFEIITLPETPFDKILETPILFGNSRIERINGKIIVYADIIVSSFFLLSRYEEILKSECRDKYGRFLSKDSVIFQQGYGNRPLADEYGVLLRTWLKEAGFNDFEENKGFSKIFLTHDVDAPFHFLHFKSVLKQIIINILNKNIINSTIKLYYDINFDDYYTFPKIIKYDNDFKRTLAEETVQSIYFFLTAGSLLNLKYYNIDSKKIKLLLNYLIKNNSKLGLHISREAGLNPKKIKREAYKLKMKIKQDILYSRHHYLLWKEPEDIEYMQQAKITDDFTLTYADCIGFRVGTCRPYRFINPITKELTDVIIHPLEIMECTCDRYMALDYENAFSHCKNIIDQVYKHNGELVLLWHNTEFLGNNYQEILYINILEYIKSLTLCAL